MATESHTAWQKLSNWSNCFGFQLLYTLKDGAQQGKNMVISPFSINQALFMVANGAEGETLNQILKSTKMDTTGSIEDVTRISSEITKFLSEVKPPNTLSVANSIWVESNHKLNDEFAKITSQLFNAETRPLTTATEVNKWCSEHTKGMISTIMDKVPSNTKMTLINAVYFKGVFQQAFPETATKPAKFTCHTGQVDIQLMDMTKHWQYKSEDKFQAVQIQYVPQSDTMPKLVSTVILPNDPKQMDEILTTFSQDTTGQHLNTGFMNREGTVMLPRFRVEYQTEISKNLQQMGITKAFSNEAEFRKICTPNDLQISSVIHKTVMEVNEKGAEAAAVTATHMKAMAIGAPPHAKFTMRCDRPFLFIIQEATTRAVLFVARIENPTLLTSSQ